MYNFSKVDVQTTLGMRKQYHVDITNPRDGMWETFVDMGEHYLITCGDETLGYLVLNADCHLLQFFVINKTIESDVFKSAIKNLNVQGAFAMTLEHRFLSLCFDHQKSVSVNDIMYACPENGEIGEVSFPQNTLWRMLENRDLQTAVDFAYQAIGADKGWLEGYYNERISAGELFGLWKDEILVAAGECRLSPYFRDVADLGMVVSNEYRGQGIATNILLKLLQACRERLLYPICSTGLDNIAAQKAIAKSGFIPDHRVLKIDF